MILQRAGKYAFHLLLHSFEIDALQKSVQAALSAGENADCSVLFERQTCALVITISDDPTTNVLKITRGKILLNFARDDDPVGPNEELAFFAERLQGARKTGSFFPAELAEFTFHGFTVDICVIISSV